MARFFKGSRANNINTALQIPFEQLANTIDKVDKTNFDIIDQAGALGELIDLDKVHAIDQEFISGKIGAINDEIEGITNQVFSGNSSVLENMQALSRLKRSTKKAADKYYRPALSRFTSINGDIDRTRKLLEDSPDLANYRIAELNSAIQNSGMKEGDDGKLVIPTLSTSKAVKDISDKEFSEHMNTVLKNVNADELGISGAVTLDKFTNAIQTKIQKGITVDKALKTAFSGVGEDIYNSFQQRIDADVHYKKRDKRINVREIFSQDGTVNMENPLAARVLGAAKGVAYTSQTEKLTSTFDNFANRESLKEANKKKAEEEAQTIDPIDMSFGIGFTANSPDELNTKIAAVRKSLEVSEKAYADIAKNPNASQERIITLKNKKEFEENQIKLYERKLQEANTLALDALKEKGVTGVEQFRDMTPRQLEELIAKTSVTKPKYVNTGRGKVTKVGTETTNTEAHIAKFLETRDEIYQSLVPEDGRHKVEKTGLKLTKPSTIEATNKHFSLKAGSSIETKNIEVFYNKDINSPVGDYEDILVDAEEKDIKGFRVEAATAFLGKIYVQGKFVGEKDKVISQPVMIPDDGTYANGLAVEGTDIRKFTELTASGISDRVMLPISAEQKIYDNIHINIPNYSTGNGLDDIATELSTIKLPEDTSTPNIKIKVFNYSDFGVATKGMDANEVSTFIADGKHTGFYSDITVNHPQLSEVIQTQTQYGHTLGQFMSTKTPN